MTTEIVRHGKIDLALHHLRRRAGDRRRLSPAAAPARSRRGVTGRRPLVVPTWPGPIAALDFTGHGGSTMSRGGGYTAEILLADADAALGALTVDDPDGAITVLGRGLGAYIALLLAGARPTQVHGAILADGPGLAGGPTGPTSQSFFSLADRWLDPRPVRPRRTRPRPATARLRRVVRATGAGRLAARRADRRAPRWSGPSGSTPSPTNTA